MKTSGIYAIVHLPSGKTYVGKSVNISKRAARHRNELTKGIHCSPKLQRAWSKYGAAQFEFRLLEEVLQLELLIEREQYWMDKIKLGVALYNTCPKAGSAHGMKLTPEQRLKISMAHKGKPKSEKHKTALRAGAKTRVHTDEEVAHWGSIWKGRTKSPEHLAKIGASIKATWERKRLAKLAST